MHDGKPPQSWYEEDFGCVKGPPRTEPEQRKLLARRIREVRRQDREDVRIAMERIADPNDTPIPLDQLIRELG